MYICFFTANGGRCRKRLVDFYATFPRSLRSSSASDLKQRSRDTFAYPGFDGRGIELETDAESDFESEIGKSRLGVEHCGREIRAIHIEVQAKLGSGLIRVSIQ